MPHHVSVAIGLKGAISALRRAADRRCWDAPMAASASPSPLRDVAAAAGGAAVTDTIFNPLEVVKVRMQLDQGGRMYRGLRQTAWRIASEEGVLLGLWLPGLAATWLRAASQTGLRVGLYPSIKQAYASCSPGQLSDSLLLKAVAGASTGAAAAALANPVDLVRVKLQGESGLLEKGLYETGLRAGHPPSHANTLAAFVDIARAEGPAGLWRGVSASICRVALLSGAKLSTYDQAKQTSRRWLHVTDGPLLHIGCSSLSGLVAQIACMPADVVKTRVQSGLHSGRYTGPLHCFVRIFLDEGPVALYRGFTAAAARQVPVMTVQMPIVERLRRVLGLGYM